MPRDPRAILAALGTAALLGSLSATATSQQTWTVDASGGAQFTQISAAVNAAADGDIILVGNGAYLPFVVNGKGLTILANGGANIFPGGFGPILTPPQIVVENLAAHQRTTIVGISPLNMMTPPTCVLVQNCAGPVWLQGLFVDSYGAPSLHVENCAEVVLTDVFCQTNTGFTQPNGVGVPAVGARFLNSAVRAYDCSFTGSHGTLQNNPFPALTAPVVGGNGVDVIDSRVLLQGCAAGGGGGTGLWTGSCLVGGDGGDGAVLSSMGGNPPELRLLDSQLSGGPVSYQTCSQTAVAGLPSRVLAGQIVQLPGATRLLSNERSVLTPTTLNLDLVGEPGDVAFVFAAFPSPTTIVLGLPLHLSSPAIALGFASIGNNREGTLALPIAPLGASAPDVQLALQSLVIDTAATPFATNPTVLVVR